MNSVAAACIRFAFSLLLFFSVLSANAFAPPKFQGNVLDETGTLNPAQTAALLQRIQELRQDGIWAAVYIARNLQGDSIEDGRGQDI